ncbi:MAG: hypothetical protein GF355_03845 [Candidatus Eisenbacteria bacterium]|nr:hypothetical protein [Candidatus Eisenbacteria bacterium]
MARHLAGKHESRACHESESQGRTRQPGDGQECHGEIPLVELNAGRILELNEFTADLAQSMGKHLVAASDSHTGQVGRAYTMAPGDTQQEFLEIHFRIFVSGCRATHSLQDFNSPVIGSSLWPVYSPEMHRNRSASPSSATGYQRLSVS